MNRIRDEIDRELSGLTFEKIEKGARGEPPEKRKEKKMKFNKKIITGIAAAAALATVTVTAGAVSDWNYGKLINGFFSHQDTASTQSTEGTMQDGQDKPVSETTGQPADLTPSASAVALLDPLIQNAEITSTFTNYNARFDGIIYDGKVLMASVNLAAKDGTPFDPEHSYSGFFNVKGIGSMSGREWWRVNEDGTLQAYCQFDQADEASEVEISYYYVLQDSEMLKYQPADELPPEEVLDPGSIIAKLTLEKSEICKDVELRDADGNVINAHITPTSVELIYSEEFIGGRMIESGQIPKYCEIYGKNGEVLLRANDYSGGVGDETGRGYKGVPYFLGTFSRIIDVNEIAGVACGDFSYGEIPE